MAERSEAYKKLTAIAAKEIDSHFGATLTGDERKLAIAMWVGGYVFCLKAVRGEK